MARQPGLMVVIMRAIILMIKKKVKDNFNGVMEKNTLVNGKQENSMVKEFTSL